VTRYSAFISYSHSDQPVTRWLHRALEGYRLPKALRGTESPFGPVPKRLPPVFRDRDELPASGDLGEELRAALAASRFQIVICSPRAAASKWVNEEILSFKRIHGEYRTLALIADGEPYSGTERECFPAALRFKLAPDGTLSDLPAEPIAADIRPGKDGKRLALLKLVAGIAGVPLDSLARRDAARRQRRLIAITSASLAVSFLTIGLAIYAESQRRIAVRQERLADRSLQFLIDTFAIANPATENPRTITALTILQRASRRAATELKDEPLVTARLLRATGEIYLNLGLPNEAEKDLKSALVRLPDHGEERGRTLLKLAFAALKRGDVPTAHKDIDAAAAAIPGDPNAASEIHAQIREQRAGEAVMDGRYGEAADLFDQTARLYQGLDGDHREAVARVWMNRAQTLRRLHRYEEADRLFVRSEELYVQTVGTNHVETATAIHNHAVADFERGRVDSAARRIDEAVAIYDRVLDRDHPTTGAALILMGRIRAAKRDFSGAIAAFNRARTLYSRLYAPDNPAVGDTDFYAASAEADRGDISAALTLLDRTKAIYDKSYGPEDPDQLELLVLRSHILIDGRRNVEARQDCAAAIALESRLKAANTGLADIAECRRFLKVR
jgi:tetratricopeptide (TPR) repeat protein